MASFLDTLKERIVVFDGAMGTSLQLQNLTLDDFGGPRFEGCNENLLGDSTRCCREGPCRLP